jgi:Rieske Fe-S protein
MVDADSPGRPEGAGEAEVGRRVLLRGMTAMGLAAVAMPLASCGSNKNNAATQSTPVATPDASLATPEASVAATPKATKSASAAPTAKATKTPTASPKASPKATPKATTAPKLVKDGTTPLAPTSAIPVNHGVLFEADKYIVTQPTAGDFRGFDSLCTHQGCPVDVMDTPGEMDCSCHSSKFKITDGSVISGPAPKPMPRKPIIVEGGQIYKAKPA